MYLPIDPQQSNVQGWLAAATAVQTRGGEAHNVVIDISNPLDETATDAAIIREVDNFLRGHHRNTLSGVANTIFPQSIYNRHGPEAFYGTYRDTVLPRMKRMTHDWGRYFDRLTAWKKVKRGKIEIINPLDDLVRFMKRQVASDRTYRNAYEMTIFDPARDAGKVSNRQCLSFLSFKLTDDNKLLLTVMYRNHAYIARGLGNFIGLGRLMAFVSDETGTGMGSLTCISTHAEIDYGKNTHHGVVEGWTNVEANALLDRCRQINMSPQAA
jgi:thymidylate synthase